MNKEGGGMEKTGTVSVDFSAVATDFTIITDKGVLGPFPLNRMVTLTEGAVLHLDIELAVGKDFLG
jgi:hypothetical protein